MSLEPDCHTCGHPYESHDFRRPAVPRCYAGRFKGSRCDCGEYVWPPDVRPVRSTTRALLCTELWLMDADPLPEVSLPVLRNVRTGKGAPGIVKGVLRILKPGTIIEVIDE